MFSQLALIIASAAVVFGQGGLGLGFQELSHGQGAAYGGQGHLNQALSGYGQGHHEGQSQLGHQAFGQQGQYGSGLAQHHNAQGAHQGLDAAQHNRGVFSRNRGHGYERVFSYDKVHRLRNNGGRQSAHGGYFGTGSGLQAHQQGGQAGFGQSTFGSGGQQGGYATGHQGLLNSGYGQQGGNYGHGQQLLQQEGHLGLGLGK